MKSESAKRVVVAGMLLQIAVAIGVAFGIAAFLHAIGSVGAKDDVSSSAAKISADLTRTLLVVGSTRLVGFVGLILMVVGIASGRLRHKWVFWWSCVCMVPWLLTFGFGTIIGLSGLILLLVKRKEFVA